MRLDAVLNHIDAGLDPALERLFALPRIESAAADPAHAAARRDDNNVYSPNERYDPESFRKGTSSWARVVAALTGAADG